MRQSGWQTGPEISSSCEKTCLPLTLERGREGENLVARGRGSLHLKTPGIVVSGGEDSVVDVGFEFQLLSL